MDVPVRIHLVSYPPREQETWSQAVVQVVQLTVAPMLAVPPALLAGHRAAIIPT